MSTDGSRVREDSEVTQVACPRDTPPDSYEFGCVQIRRLKSGIVFACLAVFLATSGGCASAPDAEAVRIYQQALDAFDHAASPADYLRSAGLYQELMDRDIVSGGLLYNQGNAYMRAVQRGRAIACYRQASKYRPRDPQLQANLQLALGAGTPLHSDRSLLDHLIFWQDWISYPGKLQATGLSASLAFVLGVLALRVPPRRLFGRLAVVVLAVTVLAAGSAVHDWYRFDVVERGVVVRAEVIARKGNADSYEPAFTEPLAEGTEFRVLERRSPWMHIQLAGGQRGWIPDDDAVTY
jgi:hypothetical protein